MTKINSFAIWGNTDKRMFWETLPRVLEWGKQNKVQPYLTTRIVKQFDDRSYPIINEADDFNNVNFVLTLGGDGTILSAARAIAHRKVPILGIHLGDLGFMAKVTLPDILKRLGQVKAGTYTVSKHGVLESEIIHNGDAVLSYALNDIVINNGTTHRMVSCMVEADGRFIGKYKADGIIVATPTGSTAYSLSAGGPIVETTVKSLIVTPICPHSLTSRPLVVPDSSEIKITFPNEPVEKIGVTLDGQIFHDYDNTAIIKIRKAGYKIRFIDFEDCSYYTTLRNKMGWGKRGEED